MVHNTHTNVHVTYLMFLVSSLTFAVSYHITFNKLIQKAYKMVDFIWLGGNLRLNRGISLVILLAGFV